MKIETREALNARREQAKAWLAAEQRVILVCAGTEDCLDVLKEFHNSLLAGYQVIMSGDTNTLYKMKDLWTFLSRSFESPDKYVKKIRKATDVSDYKLAVNALFRECALKSS